MTFESMTTLRTLTDSKLKFTDPNEDIRGRKVLDKAGEDIGSIENLMVDDLHWTVRFLQVSSGGFLGLGDRTFLIPVDAITSVTKDAVHIDHTREHLAGAPPYDPTLEPDPKLVGDLYDHFGYRPYWLYDTSNPASPYNPDIRDMEREADSGGR